MTEPAKEQVDVLTGEVVAIPKEPEVKAKPKKDEHTPPEDSKRWKDMYKSEKQGKRDIDALKEQNAEMQSNFESLKEHNKELAKSLNGIHDTIVDSNAPDPVENPDEYAEYVITKGKTAGERKFKELKDEADVKKKADPPPVTDKRMETHKAQIAVMEDMYDDYGPLVDGVMEEMKSDTELYNRVWNSKNPAVEAYKYAKEKAADVKKTTEQGFVESGGGPTAPSKGVTKLTVAQKQMAKQFGISEADYIEQVDIISKKKG